MFEISWVTNTASDQMARPKFSAVMFEARDQVSKKYLSKYDQHKLLENCTEIVISHTSSVKLPLNIAETKVSTLLCRESSKRSSGYS